MRLKRWFHLALVTLAACNALDEPGPKGDSVRLIPTDVRAAKEALTAPPAISGGTLAATSDGRFVIAADPDRDRVSIVEPQLGAASVVRHVALQAGDEPGRVVADASGYAYVALRHSGDVALIDLAQAALVTRAHACAAPRGLAIDPSAGTLVVACAEGRLLTLTAAADAAPLTIVKDVHVADDLRDVMVRPDALQVTTFRSAELLTVGDDGSVIARAVPPVFTNPRPDPDGLINVQRLQAQVAWRTLRSAGGDVIMLHQGSSTDEVAIDKASIPAAANQGSPYGGGPGANDTCEGIVVPALTRVGATPGDVTTTPVASGVLTVDMAISSDDQQLALVQAGAHDDSAPQPQVVFNTEGDVAPTASFVPPSVGFGFGVGPIGSLPDGIDLSTSGTSRLTLTSPGNMRAPSPGCIRSGDTRSVIGQATAVTFVHRPGALKDDVVVQSREPAGLTILFGDVDARGQPQAAFVDLGGASVRDTGHEIFHRDAGAGVACASCHPEGREDGHVWKFNTVGVRRTQALHVGLEGTAPFHWNGEEADLGHLMEDVFVGRMGGVHQSEARLSTLTHWLFSLQPTAAGRPDDSEAVTRGQALFQAPEIGCSGCHSGAKLTDNQTVDVGTGAKLQVPSLRAVAYRAPYMHTGCAKSLRERFDPACGGSKHGNTSGLDERQIGDLVAYLKTL